MRFRYDEFARAAAAHAAAAIDTAPGEADGSDGSDGSAQGARASASLLLDGIEGLPPLPAMWYELNRRVRELAAHQHDVERSPLRFATSSSQQQPWQPVYAFDLVHGLADPEYGENLSNKDHPWRRAMPLYVDVGAPRGGGGAASSDQGFAHKQYPPFAALSQYTCLSPAISWNAYGALEEGDAADPSPPCDELPCGVSGREHVDSFRCDCCARLHVGGWMRRRIWVPKNERPFVRRIAPKTRTLACLTVDLLRRHAWLEWLLLGSAKKPTVALVTYWALMAVEHSWRFTSCDGGPSDQDRSSQRAPGIDVRNRFATQLWRRAYHKASMRSNPKSFDIDRVTTMSEGQHIPVLSGHASDGNPYYKQPPACSLRRDLETCLNYTVPYARRATLANTGR